MAEIEAISARTFHAVGVARGEARKIARQISVHHQGCRCCQAGGRMVFSRRGLTRIRCEQERDLFTQLREAQQAGWPR